MPDKCSKCDFLSGLCPDCTYICKFPVTNIRRLDITRAVEEGVRHSDCPFVEVPEPHGRLIDKDRLKREMLWNFAGEKIPLYDCDNNPVDFHVKDVEATINSQPTVIEAEGK